MPRKSDKPLQLVTIKLFAGDREALQEFYPAPIGYNLAIRTLVHSHVKKLREQASRQKETASDFNPGTIDVDSLIGTASGSGGDDPVG